MPTSRSNVFSNIQFVFFCLALISLLLPIKLSSWILAGFIISSLPNFTFQHLKQNIKSQTSVFVFMIAYFLWNLFSLAYSADLHSGLKDVESKLSLLLMPIIIYGTKLNYKQIRNALFAFAWACVAASLLAFSLSFYFESRLLSNQELAGLIGMHASYLGVYIAFSFFVLMDNLKEQSRRRFALMGMLVLFFAIIFLAARIVLLGFVICNLVWFLKQQFNLKRIATSIAGLAIIGLVSWNYEPIQVRIIEAIDFEDKVILDADPELYLTLNRNFGGRAIRVAIWTCAMDIVESDWLLGVGTGDVHEALQASYKNHAFEFAWKYNNYNAHNVFLESLIGLGVVGVFILLSLFFNLFKMGIQRQDVLLFSFTILFFFLSLMESTLNVHKGIVLFCLIIPALSLSQKKRG